MGNKTLIRVGASILAVILILFLFQTSGLINIDSVEFKSHGQSPYSISGAESLFKSLGINTLPDYIDDETGEEYCFNPDCWDEATTAYVMCLDDGADVMFSAVDVSEIYKFIEIIPAAYAIADGGLPDEEDECMDLYWDSLTHECRIVCEEELYVWDGSPVNDLGSFLGYAYPDARHRWINRCEGWLHEGTWVEEADEVGCVNARLLTCDSESIMSAQDVCGEIGKTWQCNETDITCED